MGVADGIELAFRLAFQLGNAVYNAIQAGNVSTVDELTKHLDTPEGIQARAEALIAAKEKLAEKELSAALSAPVRGPEEIRALTATRNLPTTLTPPRLPGACVTCHGLKTIPIENHGMIDCPHCDGSGTEP